MGPWGTPLLVSKGSDKHLSKEVCYALFDQYEHIHLALNSSPISTIPDCPHVSAVPCDIPSEPTNGYYAPSPPSGGFHYGHEVTFHCDASYAMSGSETSSCQASRTWSDATPSCICMYTIIIPYLYDYSLLITIWDEFQKITCVMNRWYIAPKWVALCPAFQTSSHEPRFIITYIPEMFINTHYSSKLLIWHVVKE